MRYFIVADVCLIVSVDPPYFVVRPKSFYQRELMQTVVMPCVADGDPSPNIVWRRVRSTVIQLAIKHKYTIQSTSYIGCDDERVSFPW